MRRLFRRMLRVCVVLWSAALTACTGNTQPQGDGSAPIIAAFTANPSSVSGGEPVTLAWDVRGAEALSLDPGGSALTGTNLTLWPAVTTTYRLTARNANGTATAMAVVTVRPTAPSSGPPRELSYSTNPAVYTIGEAIEPNAPTSAGGAILSYAVSPALPAGLWLHPVSGVMGGTPSSISSATPYTVTGWNADGSTAATVTITVRDVPPTNLTYSANPGSYAAGVAITPNTPSSGGGAIVAYEVSPALPDGLSLSATTGVITGAPLAPADPEYRVVASNSGGSTSATLIIDVKPPAPPAVRAPVQDQFALPGETATFRVDASGTGNLTYQWSRAGTPIAGATASSYVTTAATGSDDGTAFGVAVTDAFGGTATSSARLWVQGFKSAGRMTSTRAGHAASSLADGGVLVTGRVDQVSYGTAGNASGADLYDPAARTFKSTGAMQSARGDHAATVLPGGKVLVTGGLRLVNSAYEFLSTAELYDSSTGTFGPTGSMAVPRAAHSATLLPDGTVLIAGGESDSGALATAELYDPSTGLFTPTGSMTTARSAPIATLLRDGMVLVASGRTAELYDPAARSFTATGSMMATRSHPTWTLLGDGTVLVAGGGTAEIYDPRRGTFEPTGAMIARRSAHSATLTDSGKVLIAGGYDADLVLITTEVYDPATRTFSPSAPMSLPRYSHTATLLSDGTVLITGGVYEQYHMPYTDTAEVWQPAQ